MIDCYQWFEFEEGDHLIRIGQLICRVIHEIELILNPNPKQQVELRESKRKEKKEVSRFEGG